MASHLLVAISASASALLVGVIVVQIPSAVDISARMLRRRLKLMTSLMVLPVTPPWLSRLWHRVEVLVVDKSLCQLLAELQDCETFFRTPNEEAEGKKNVYLCDG